MTEAGSAAFGAIWRGREAKLVECPALAVWSLDDRVGVNDDPSTVAWHRLDALGDEGLPFYPQGAVEAARSMLDRGSVARA